MSDHVSALLRIHSASLRCPFDCNHIHIYPKMENASLSLLPFYDSSCYFVASEGGERSFVYYDTCEHYPDGLSWRSNRISLSFNDTCSIPIVRIMYRFVTSRSFFHHSGEGKGEIALFQSCHPGHSVIPPTEYPLSRRLHYIILFSSFAQLQFHCLLL